MCSSSCLAFARVGRKQVARNASLLLENQYSPFDKWSWYSLRVRDTESSEDFTPQDGHCIQKETPQRNSCCLVRVKPHVARLWDFSRNATIWIMWISRFLNVGSLRKKKNTTPQNTQIKQNTSAGWAWQLGHQFATCDREAEICIMYWKGCGWAVRAGAEEPPGEICDELGEGVWVQIVDYLKCHPLLPILEKKMFSVCSTLFPALKQKPSLPASLL